MQSINIPVTACIANPTALQLDIANYYFQISSYVTAYITKAQNRELFGHDATGEYNKINDLYYLLNFILEINDQRQIDLNNGVINSCSYYAQRFDCMIDYFKCLNIDITPLLCIFGFYCNCPANIPPVNVAVIGQGPNQMIVG